MTYQPKIEILTNDAINVESADGARVIAFALVGDDEVEVGLFELGIDERPYLLIGAIIEGGEPVEIHRSEYGSLKEALMVFAQFIKDEFGGA